MLLKDVPDGAMFWLQGKIYCRWGETVRDGRTLVRRMARLAKAGHLCYSPSNPVWVAASTPVQVIYGCGVQPETSS